MYGKIQITGTVEILTGMHIGGSDVFAAIGAVDAPIIKDVSTNLPMIPGSSMKGKLRSLLARQYNEEVATSPDNDHERLTRLFGSAKKGKVKRSRILFSDMILSNAEELRVKGLQSLTEIKFENTINRITAVANPRQIERAVRGSIFDLDLMYEAEQEDELEEDFETLVQGFQLLEYDYLGGNGSRGYGKIAFHDLHADVVFGDITEQQIDHCNRLLDSLAKNRSQQTGSNNA